MTALSGLIFDVFETQFVIWRGAPVGYYCASDLAPDMVINALGVLTIHTNASVLARILVGY